LRTKPWVSTTQLVQTLLEDPVVDRHPRAVRVLKLRATVGMVRLEAACARALRFGDLTYATLKRILDQRLEAKPPPSVPVAPPARTCVRTAAELLGHLFGGLGGAA
jgi:hypothetical protein